MFHEGSIFSCFSEEIDNSLSLAVFCLFFLPSLCFFWLFVLSHSRDFAHTLMINLTLDTKKRDWKHYTCGWAFWLWASSQNGLLGFFFFCCCVCVGGGGNIPDVYFLRFFLKIFQSKEFNLLSEQCRANFNVYTGHPRNCWNADSDSGGLGQGWDAVSSLQLLPCSMDASCLKFRSLLIYFWLYWVFAAVCGLSLVVVNRGYSSLLCTGFSLWWLLCLLSTGSRVPGPG